MRAGVTGSLHVSVEIDGDTELSRKLQGYLGRVGNWKPFFESVAENWSSTRERIFAAEGAFEGQEAWQPLSERYAAWKARHYPGMPTLQRTGALLEAVTNPETEIDDQRMVLTVPSEYAVYHQSSRARKSNLPRRPFASLTSGEKRRIMRGLREHIFDEE